MTRTHTTATHGYVASAAAMAAAALDNQTRDALFAILADNVKWTCEQTQDQTNNSMSKDFYFISYTVHDRHTYNSYARLRS